MFETDEHDNEQMLAWLRDNLPEQGDTYGEDWHRLQLILGTLGTSPEDVDWDHPEVRRWMFVLARLGLDRHLRHRLEHD